MSERKQTLGERIRQRRRELGLSTIQLAMAVQINQSNIVRFESGEIASPAPDKLSRIAAALELPATELLELAGYSALTELPSFAPYMRAKYQGLSSADVDAIEAYAAQIAARRGVSLTGPKPGEDE